MELIGEAHTMWHTPVLARRVPVPDGYNPQLRELILDRQRRQEGTTAGVVDADKTQSDLLRWDDPLTDTLKTWIAEAVTTLNGHVRAGQDASGADVDMVAEAWAVVYREWGYHNLHSHHDSAWSGVYYVHTGQIVDGSGQIEFLDPRPAACAREPWRPPLHSLAPEPGLLLAFPSWLQHWVTPYEGDSNRVCVAFNAGFKR
ncbi:TIGR02466 family protein [Micromonospora chokoriensis]